MMDIVSALVENSYFAGTQNVEEVFSQERTPLCENGSGTSQNRQQDQTMLEIAIIEHLVPWHMQTDS